jgi:aldehyde dehydrogenase
MERALKRVAAIKQGSPLDPTTMIGAQASSEQLEKILSYIDIGKQEGAEVLTGGARNDARGDLAGGYYVSRPSSRPQQDAHLPGGDLRAGGLGDHLQDDDEALEIANDTLYGLGAGVWSRDANRCYRFGRGIQAGRVWTNCYHAYPGPRGLRRLQAVRHRPRDAQA